MNAKEHLSKRTARVVVRGAWCMASDLCALIKDRGHVCIGGEYYQPVLECMSESHTPVNVNDYAFVLGFGEHYVWVEAIRAGGGRCDDCALSELSFRVAVFAPEVLAACKLALQHRLDLDALADAAVAEAAAQQSVPLMRMASNGDSDAP